MWSARFYSGAVFLDLNSFAEVVSGVVMKITEAMKRYL